MLLTNSGTIIGGIHTANPANTSDIVINTGLISGSIELGGGSDTYDGVGGRVTGFVNLGAGSDTFLGSDAVDNVFSSAGDDTFDLGGGNDRYDAEANDGNDTVEGGLGTDLYNAAGISGAFGVFIDLDLEFAGGAPIGGDAISGFENAIGSQANDTLLGTAGRNVLDGNSGNDTIDGRGGADVMKGGLGNDTFIVDNTNDSSVELFNGGNDTVRSSVTINLNNTGNNIETLILTGTAEIDGTGNISGNFLFGNSAKNVLSGDPGNDALFGFLGNDTLSGGTLNDFFVFNTALNATTNVDTITDFVAADDTFRLENTGANVFNALTITGTLATAAFKANATGVADEADDRIIYNTATGELFFDADGTGATGAIKFAILSTKPTVTEADFVVI